MEISESEFTFLSGDEQDRADLTEKESSTLTAKMITISRVAPVQESFLCLNTGSGGLHGGTECRVFNGVEEAGKRRFNPIIEDNSERRDLYG